MVWVRRTAIRTVPGYARVSPASLHRLRESLTEDDDTVRRRLDAAFDRFERTQPELSAWVTQCLGRPLDETALALGYFLVLAVWLSFEEGHGGNLDRVREPELRGTLELIDLDETLRRSDAAEALDTDDVIALEQPDLLEFVNEQVDATLESHADEVDVDDVHTVYRMVLVEVLALSYAVRRPAGHPSAKPLFLA